MQRPTVQADGPPVVCVVARQDCIFDTGICTALFEDPFTNHMLSIFTRATGLFKNSAEKNKNFTKAPSILVSIERIEMP